MAKIISAQDILRQKGFVKNKFNSNKFLEVVGNMFLDLPIEGHVTLKPVRFVEAGVPLSEEETAQGFYYLSGKHLDTQMEYGLLKEKSSKLDERLENTYAPHKSRKLGKMEDNADYSVGTFLRMQGWRDVPVQTCPEEYFPMIDEYLKNSLYGRQSITCKREDFVYTALLNRGWDEHKLNLWKERYDRCMKAANDYEDLKKEAEDASVELNKFYYEKYEELCMDGHTVYVDKPFAVNAAGMLRIMGGYVVERHVKSGSPYWIVTLV